MFGWVARADDLTTPGAIGQHLRENGDLKTVAELEDEGSRKTDKLVGHLASQIEVKNKHAQQLESKYNETTSSLEKIMEDKELIVQKYNQGNLLLFTSSVMLELSTYICAIISF
jgi:hypothetical protein